MKQLLAITIISVLFSCKSKIDYQEFKNSQDYNLPLFDDTIKNKTALLIFAHPDDEIACAGTIDQLNKNGWTINLLTLAQGEPEQKSTRISEWKNSVGILQIDNYEILDLPSNSWDNVLKNDIHFWYDQADSIENIVYTAIQKYNPTLVFTYDTAFGGYGNPEHRMSAIAVNNVFQKHKTDSLFPVEKIFQITLPEKLELLMYASSEPYENVIKHLGNRTLPEPTLAFDIANNWTVKRKASAAYISQAGTLKKFYLLPEPADTTIHYKTFDREYYYEVKK